MRDGALAEHGYVVVEHVVEPQRLASIEGYLGRVGMNSAGTRQLLEHEWCRDLAREIRCHGVISSLLPLGAVAVQCTLFEKSEGRNWLVPFHQDVHIPVRRRVDHPALSGWSEKEGTVFVCPPAEVLDAFVAIRVHIDDCGPEHGALRVVPGSHAEGRLDQRAAEARRERLGERVCAVERGGALVMKPLLLHASSKATRPNRRRVLHFLVGPTTLPFGLEHAHVA